MYAFHFSSFVTSLSLVYVSQICLKKYEPLGQKSKTFENETATKETEDEDKDESITKYTFNASANVDESFLKFINNFFEYYNEKEKVRSNSKKDFTEKNKECTYLLWSKWSDCTVTCGLGVQVRHRLLVTSKENCNDKDFVEEKDCQLLPCIHSFDYFKMFYKRSQGDNSNNDETVTSEYNNDNFNEVNEEIEDQDDTTITHNILHEDDFKRDLYSEHKYFDQEAKENSPVRNENCKKNHRILFDTKNKQSDQSFKFRRSRSQGPDRRENFKKSFFSKNKYLEKKFIKIENEYIEAIEGFESENDNNIFKRNDYKTDKNYKSDLNKERENFKNKNSYRYNENNNNNENSHDYSFNGDENNVKNDDIHQKTIDSDFENYDEDIKDGTRFCKETDDNNDKSNENTKKSKHYHKKNKLDSNVEDESIAFNDFDTDNDVSDLSDDQFEINYKKFNGHKNGKNIKKDSRENQKSRESNQDEKQNNQENQQKNYKRDFKEDEQKGSKSDDKYKNNQNEKDGEQEENSYKQSNAKNTENNKEKVNPLDSDNEGDKISGKEELSDIDDKIDDNDDNDDNDDDDDNFSNDDNINDEEDMEQEEMDDLDEPEKSDSSESKRKLKKKKKKKKKNEKANKNNRCLTEEDKNGIIGENKEGLSKIKLLEGDVSIIAENNMGENYNNKHSITKNSLEKII